MSALVSRYARGNTIGHDMACGPDRSWCGPAGPPKHIISMHNILIDMDHVSPHGARVECLALDVIAITNLGTTGGSDIICVQSDLP